MIELAPDISTDRLIFIVDIFRLVANSWNEGWGDKGTYFNTNFTFKTPIECYYVLNKA